MLKSYLAPAVVAACLCGAAFQANAGTLNWAGDTLSANSGGIWNRPTVNDNPGTFLALSGKNETYFEEEFTVSAAGTYSLTVTPTGPGIGAWNSGTETSILAFLYQDAFDPANSLVNEIEDGAIPNSLGNATPDWSHDLLAGHDYFIVVSGYCGTTGTGNPCIGPSALEGGPFAASLTGPGEITQIGQSTVPEPASWTLMMVGLGGIGAAMRRGRRSKALTVNAA